MFLDSVKIAQIFLINVSYSNNPSIVICIFFLTLRFAFYYVLYCLQVVCFSYDIFYNIISLFFQRSALTQRKIQNIKIPNTSATIPIALLKLKQRWKSTDWLHHQIKSNTRGESIKILTISQRYRDYLPIHYYVLCVNLKVINQKSNKNNCVFQIRIQNLVIKLNIFFHNLISAINCNCFI